MYVAEYKYKLFCRFYCNTLNLISLLLTEIILVCFSLVINTTSTAITTLNTPLQIAATIELRVQWNVIQIDSILRS
jgi:hypothetical protein